MFLIKGTDQLWQRSYKASIVFNLTLLNAIETQWKKTLHSAAVAAVRSGNERAVKLVQMSWAIKKGASLTTPIDLATLDNIWMGWGFRVNFIHSPVH
jgi:hypothetical protein